MCYKLAGLTTLIRLSPMIKILLAVLIAVVVTTSGCKTHSGSREYKPGKGWVPN